MSSPDFDIYDDENYSKEIDDFDENASQMESDNEMENEMEWDEDYGFLDPERKAVERVGKREEFLTNFMKGDIKTVEGKKLGDIYNLLFRQFATDEERFQKLVEIYVFRLKDDMKLGDEEQDEVMNISWVPNIRYKNAIAYIFGYYVLDDRKQIVPEKIQKSRKLLKEFDEEVSIEDVIRYARLWINKK